MIGFNAGVNISLGDMEIALDYLQDKDIYKEELAEVRHKRVGSSSQTGVDKEQTLMVKDIDSGNEDNYYEEDEDLDFGDEDSDEDLDLDFGDEDSDFGDEDSDEESEEGLDLDFGDEDSEEDLDEESEEDLDFGDEESDEDLDEDSDEDFDFGDEESEEDLDFGDEEEQPVKVAKVQVEQPVKTAKSDRELELEKRLAQFEKADEVRKENERLEVIEKQRALAIQESANAKKREAELERKLAEAEKLLEERESNESIEKHPEAKHVSSINNRGSNTTNSSTRNGKATRQRQLVNSERKVMNHNTDDIDYSKLEIEALWEDVRRFMVENGVASQLVSKSIVEQKFGVVNIKRLYLKGYLIPFGSKLTIGK